MLQSRTSILQKWFSYLGEIFNILGFSAPYQLKIQIKENLKSQTLRFQPKELLQGLCLDFCSKFRAFTDCK